MPVTSATHKIEAIKAPGHASCHVLAAGVRRHRLVKVVADALSDAGLYRGCDKGPAALAIGVSGGSDSMALLIACAIVRARRDRRHSPLNLVAVHVHHHLRPSADDDQHHVEAWCERLSVPCRVMHVDPSGGQGNLAARARTLRYQALAQAGRDAGTPYIAVAHQAEDQLETMIMALGRGTSLAGLAAMPAVGSLPCGAILLRPMLGAARAEARHLCQVAGVPWRDDPSNLDITRSRARLRMRVLPELEAMWPGAADRAVGTASMLADAWRVVLARIETVFGEAHAASWPRDRLRREPAIIVSGGLRRAALAHSPGLADSINQHMLEIATRRILADDHAPCRFNWPGGLLLSVSAGRVELRSFNEARRSS